MKELTHIVGMHETQIRQAIAVGSFPRPFKLNDWGRSIGWDEGEINEWLRKRRERNRVDVTATVGGKRVTSKATRKKARV